MPTILIIGTCDTKLDELLFLRESILSFPLSVPNLEVILMDVGHKASKHEAISISQSPLFLDDTDVSGLSRNKFITFISNRAVKVVQGLHDSPKGLHGVIALGGSCGTTIAGNIMRSLPLGLPKVIVSTVASGDMGVYVGESDITMVNSVVDIAGLNGLLRRVIGNAAGGVVGAAVSYEYNKNHSSEEEVARKRRLGITMFGVTTPAVEAIRKCLGETYGEQIEVYVFHATGHGGKAMEKMVRDGGLDAVLDLTTTEVADFVVGGVMSAGEGRMSAPIEKQVPYLVSLGATDMVNFGARETVPERFKGRRLVEHNAAVTLMRINKEEAREIGRFMVGKLRGVERPGMVKVVIPKGGTSLLSKARGLFEEREVDEVLFGVLREGLEGSGIEVVEDKRDINDEGLARMIAGLMGGLMG